VVLQVSKQRDSLPSKRHPPLLVKIAPDLTDDDKQDIADVVLKKTVSQDCVVHVIVNCSKY